ncbi:UvrB/UvrC motif-containing protein [Oceanobacillus alkalisoli]|uniref:UvrB/UvrC motif-containing protein n=1 Tax=Oceanobacillus alkalisoli TaxID=2925113 RepID=UPI0021023CFA|nr:UvrB/UvrC motif-containing protein [Oceanobacillus alkalisoli]
MRVECQECQKRPATVYFKHVINGEKKEVRVCEVCAQEKGYMQSQDQGSSLHDLLTGIFNFDTYPFGTQVSDKKQIKELQCPNCKLTFSAFKEIGKFGCATCYETFSERLSPILRRVHAGNTAHAGKIPKRTGGNIQKKRQLEEYRIQMKKLIEEEAFEEAAILRDKIKALETQGSAKRGESEG